MNNKEFIEKYEELLNSGYCECNELNCLDNNPPRKILNIMKEQQEEIQRLKEEYMILQNASDKREDELIAESTKWESKFYDEAKKVDRAIEFIVKNENNISSIKDLENNKTYNSALLYVKSILQGSDKE